MGEIRGEGSVSGRIPRSAATPHGSGDTALVLPLKDSLGQSLTRGSLDLRVENVLMK